MRHTLLRLAISCFLFTAAAVLAHAPAQAAIGEPYDTPTITCASAGETEITLKVTAGPSGAPAGVSIQWMTKDDYDNYGWDNNYMCALSLSGQPSYSGNVAFTRWELGSNEFFEIKIGELPLYETGLSVHGTGCDQALACGTTYIFRVFAHATNEHKRSAFSTGTECSTADCPSEDCTLTLGGYGQNGPGICNQGNDGKNFWPAQVLADGGMNLGANWYSVAKLCAILQNGEGGNCYRQLARQLIAAKFNVMWGATCDWASTNITAADALIGTKNIGTGEGGDNTVECPSGGGANATLRNQINTVQGNLNLYNNGYDAAGCPAHCDGAPQFKIGSESFAPTPTRKTTWGSVKQIHR